MMHDYGLELLLFCSSQVNIYIHGTPLTSHWFLAFVLILVLLFSMFLLLFSRIVWVLKAIKPLKRMKCTIQNVMISMPHPISSFSQRINNNFDWKHLAQKLTSVLKIFIISSWFVNKSGPFPEVYISYKLLTHSLSTFSAWNWDWEWVLIFLEDWQIFGVHRSIMTSFV